MNHEAVCRTAPATQGLLNIVPYVVTHIDLKRQKGFNINGMLHDFIQCA